MLSSGSPDHPAHVSKLSLKEALESDPLYRHVHAKRQLLAVCLKQGLMHWMKVAPVSFIEVAEAGY